MVIQVYPAVKLLSAITGMIFELQVDNFDVSLKGGLKLN